MSPLALFKCLCDDTRLTILLLVSQQKELCVCELTDALRVSQPKISRHLAALKKQALLLDRKSGQWVFYRVNPQLSPWVYVVIEQAMAASEKELADLVTRLNLVDEPMRTAACC
ncbi:MAG: metalloregulator ArsR/SmtB family transcription factor [Bermanella sp.]